MEYYFCVKHEVSYVFASITKDLELVDPSICKVKDLYVMDISEEHLKDYLTLKRALDGLS